MFYASFRKSLFLFDHFLIFLLNDICFLNSSDYRKTTNKVYLDYVTENDF